MVRSASKMLFTTILMQIPAGPASIVYNCPVGGARLATLLSRNCVNAPFSGSSPEENFDTTLVSCAKRSIWRISNNSCVNKKQEDSARSERLYPSGCAQRMNTTVPCSAAARTSPRGSNNKPHENDNKRHPLLNTTTRTTATTTATPSLRSTTTRTTTTRKERQQQQLQHRLLGNSRVECD